ncbi:MAG: DUF4112 domain-containing protein [Wenzhouxiangella sp.]
MSRSRPSVDRELQEQTLARLDRYSYYTDSNIRVPFTKFRFGLSPLIGLVPVIGDFAGLVLSLYVLFEARRVKVSRRIQARMIGHMLIEFVGGILPVVGDAFDAIYKANTRNTELLRAHLHRELEITPPKKFPWWTLVWMSVLFAVFGMVVLLMLGAILG